MTEASNAERTARIATRLGALNTRTIGAGPVAVLWPSMFVDNHTWDPLIERLRPGRTLVLVDGPGLGLSAPLNRLSSIDEAADAALDLLAGLGVNEPVDWLGNAFGGHVGFKLGARPGVLRSLIAISAPAEPITRTLKTKISMLFPLLRVFGAVGPVRAAVLDAMLTDASAVDPQIRAIVIESLGRPTRQSTANALRSFILARRDVTDELDRITVPSLYVASDDRGDWSPEDAEAAARRTPSAHAVTIPRARTLIPLEQPDLLAEEILRFWTTLA